MIYAIYGALGAVLVLLLFAVGVYVGYKLHEKKAEHEAAKRPTPEPPEMAERRRLIAEQAAFSNLVNYNADVAFGYTAGEDGEV
jgi:hypothetical protein